ncbi:MAG TPA: DoxX family protein, partial [Verrucomicrobiae bacterium]|nr:DoxX family protein [Verrucomicrobiae bacterium]
IGLAEVLGAAGLILPGVFRIRPALTPLAAVGLLIVMSGATVLMVSHLGVQQAIMPAVAGLLDGLVAWGRRGELRRVESQSVVFNGGARHAN